MQKKVIGILLCAMLCVSVFAGCGGSGTGGSIVYWSMWDAAEPQAIVLKEAIDAYTAETGVKVDVQFKGRTGIREGLQPALDAGTSIDMFDEDVDRVNGTWGAYLMDLEEMAKASDYEKTANPQMIRLCRDLGGGKLMTIPYQPNAFVFFYNQDIFDEAGVTAVPQTWDEFLAVCQKIKDAGKIPITSDDAYIQFMLGYHLSHLVGETEAENIVKNGDWAENPAVLQTAQAYEDLAKKGFFSPLIGSNVWPAGQNTELALGEAAIYLNGSWLPNELKLIREQAGVDFKWGCFGYPTIPGGKEGPEAANYGAQVFAINKNSKNAQAAFDLITKFTKGEFDKKLSDETIGIPADSANSQWPALLEPVRPVMESLTVRYKWAAGAEANVDMTPIVRDTFMKLCAGTITAQQFVDEMEAASQK